MLTSRFLLKRRRLLLFPETPDGNVAKIEGVPPGVHHRRVESKRPFAGHARGRWDQGLQPVIEQRALFVVHPIEPKALSPKLQGYVPIPDGMLRFKDVWLK